MIGEKSVVFTSAVMAAPNYGAIFGEDLLESFDDEIAYCALVMFGREGGEAVAGEFGHEERDGIFQLRDDMSPHVAALRPAMDAYEDGTGAKVMGIALDMAT